MPKEEEEEEEEEIGRDGRTMADDSTTKAQPNPVVPKAPRIYSRYQWVVDQAR